MSGALDELLEAFAGDPRLSMPPMEVVRRIRKRSHRELVLRLVRSVQVGTVGDLIEVAEDALSGRQLRRVRSDFAAAVTTLLSTPRPGTGEAPRGSPPSGGPAPEAGPAGASNRGAGSSARAQRRLPLEGPAKAGADLIALRRRFARATELRPYAPLCPVDELAPDTPDALAACPVEEVMQSAEAGVLEPAELEALERALDTLSAPHPPVPLTSEAPPAARALDELLAGLEREIAWTDHLLIPGASAYVQWDTRARVTLIVRFVLPSTAPEVRIPLPYKGPLRRADVERASPELAEGPWSEAALAIACLTSRHRLRRPEDTLGPRLAQLLAEPPWARALADASEAEGPDVDAEVWWSISIHNPGDLEVFVRRRAKRGHWWRKPTRLEAKDLGRLPLPPRERAAVAQWRGLRERKSGPESRAAHLEGIFTHLVGHPRVCFGGDPERQVEVRQDRLRVELGVGARGRARMSLAYGDGRRVTADDLREGRLVRRSHGFVGLDEYTGVLWVVDASPGLVESALRLEGLELAPEEVPEVLTWLLERGETLDPVVHGSEPIAEDELEVVVELERHGDRVEALLGLRAPDVSPVVFGPGEGVGFLVGASGDAAALRPRDRAAERRRLRAWLDAAEPPGPWTEEGGGIALDVEATLELLAALRARDDVRVRWRTGERLELSPKKVGPDALRLKVADGMHAYLLTGHLSLGSRQIALGELFEAARRGRRFVEVGAETYAALDAELQASLAAVDAVAREEGSKGQLVPAAAAPRLLELAESAPKAELSPGLEAARARVERSRRLRPEVPSDFRATLRDYQREGFAWALRLAELGLGGCLADDMGLGKTVQALAVLTARADEGPALVVAPTSVMYNWLRDGERFAPGLEPRLYHGPGRTLEGLGPRAVVVTSYGVLLRDIEALAGVRFSTLVLDEAQALKTASSQTAKAARSLSSAFTLALTGTPVENHAGELWSLFEVLAPGLLGTRRSFKARFGATREGEEDATRRRRLARALRPLVLRRSKQQVLPELPERTEVQIDVVLSKAEQSLYDAVRAKALAGLHAGRGDGPSRVEVLAVLTQLRQLACHPRLLDAGSEVTSSKHARLHELLEELVDEGRQVLVFSQFVRQLDLVAGALDARGVSFERLVGETSVGARLSAVEKFSEGQAPIFLVSLKAGGVGLNLTAADTVIFLDPWWNPAAEAQAADRAHRIGQTKPVTIYRLVARGTLEETVLSLQAEKRRLVEDVLAGTDGAAALDTDALLELLGSD